MLSVHNAILLITVAGVFRSFPLHWRLEPRSNDSDIVNQAVGYLRFHLNCVGCGSACTNVVCYVMFQTLQTLRNEMKIISGKKSYHQGAHLKSETS